MKKVRAARAKRKLEKTLKNVNDDGTVKETNDRNLKGELITTAWDMRTRQFPVTKIRYIKETINERLMETEGIKTKEIKEVEELLKRYER